MKTTVAILITLFSVNSFADFQLECNSDIDESSYLSQIVATDDEVASDPEQTITASNELGPFVIGTTVCDDDAPYLLIEISHKDQKGVSRTYVRGLDQTAYLEIDSTNWMACTLSRI